MPHFFFDFHNGIALVPSDDPIEFDTLQVAEDAAMDALLPMMRRRLADAASATAALMIRDDDHRHLATVTLTLAVYRS